MDLQAAADKMGLSLTVPEDLQRVGGGLSEFQLLLLLLLAMNGVNAGGGGSGGGGSAAAPGTPHVVLVAASGSQAIPIGAKEWSFVFLTGTGTVNGIAVPAGLGDSGQNKLAATITIATNAASTAYVRWNT